jgi:hypothetical protein
LGGVYRGVYTLVILCISVRIIRLLLNHRKKALRRRFRVYHSLAGVSGLAHTRQRSAGSQYRTEDSDGRVRWQIARKPSRIPRAARLRALENRGSEMSAVGNGMRQPGNAESEDTQEWDVLPASGHALVVGNPYTLSGDRLRPPFRCNPRSPRDRNRCYWDHDSRWGSDSRL